MRVIYDTELRSEVDLKSRGLDVYAHHHSTEMLCATVATDNFIGTATFVESSDGREALENEMRALGLTVVAPHVVLATLRAAKVVVASNVAFDQAVTRATLGVDIPKERWSCTMARAMRHGLPGSLAAGASVLGLPEGKDKEGNRLSKQVWKPRPTWTKKQTGPRWFEDAKRLARNCAYNAADVRVSRLMDKALPELEPAEREIWLHVWRMNERGIPVDVDLINGAIAISEEAMRDVTDRIRAYTSGEIQSLRAIPQLVRWAAKYSVDFPSWAKDEVAAALANPRLPEAVRVVAVARQEASRGSVAKFETASEVVAADGRLRHQLLYAGTSTLRLAGRGVQPLNLPRPKIEADKSAGLADIKAGRPLRVPEWKIRYDPEAALAAIRRGDLAALRNIGDPEEILSENIRPMIVAPPGKKIVSPDLSAIEARGVFWISGCEKALSGYRRKEDLYCSLASTIVNFPVNKKDHPEERQLGKVGILSCFEAGTGVVTRDRGVVPIERISSGDLLWDGIEWVQHQGVAARGKKLTTNFLGVSVTPDHLIMTRQGWRTVSDLQTRLRQSQSDLAIWSCAREIVIEKPDERISGVGAIAGNTAHRLWKISKKVVQRAVTIARTGWLHSLKSLRMGSPRVCQKTIIDAGGCSDTERCWSEHITEQHRQRKTIYTAGFSSPPNGWMAWCFLSGCGRSRIWTSLRTVWSGTMSTGRITRRTAASQPQENNSEINGDLTGLNTVARFTAPPNSTPTYAPASPKSQYLGLRKAGGPEPRLSRTRFADVFDVVNAGSTHRFTIVTPEGSYLLVHNCGYGAGPSKVALTNKIDEELAQRVVYGYRDEYPEVRQTWTALEDAAVSAVYNPRQTFTACRGRVSFIYEGGWLRMLRPSGTWMYLPDAGVDVEGRLFYHSWIKGAWREESIWGGVLMNFVVQGMCRELMYGAEMQIAQLPEYELFLQCYDSLSALVDEARADELCENMIRIMTMPPTWAPDFPLAAEGKPKARYS